MLLVSESVSSGDLEEEPDRRAPISGDMMLHSEIIEAPLTDRELGDLTIGFGPPAMLLIPRRTFFVGDCVRGSTISLIWQEATIAQAGGFGYKVGGQGRSTFQKVGPWSRASGALARSPAHLLTCSPARSDGSSGSHFQHPFT